MTRLQDPSPAARPPAAPLGWIGAVIFAVTLMAYLPALGAGFIWDDMPGHVTRPELRSLAGLARIWFEVGATQQYYPLLHSAFWVEHQLWGDAPFGYHLVNVLLHATSACLFVTLLRRLAVPGAWLGGLLFALHPVGVETVAWVSEQKNTLSTVLGLLAVLTYLRYDSDRRPATYAAATLAFVLALLTKTVTATLPAALLVILWWRNGHLTWKRNLAPLAPWLCLGALSGLATAYLERILIGAGGADFALAPAERLLIAGRAPWFYLGKLVWPADLTFVYPRWNLDATSFAQWLFPFATLALIAGAWCWRRSGRGLLAVALLFGGTLFPALGFLNVFPFRYSFVADHFQYLACLAPLAFGAAALNRLPPAAVRVLGVALAAVLGVLTWNQSRTYRDAFTLYDTTLARNPAAWMAHNNLAEALASAGRVAEAIPHLEQALRLRPDFPEALSNLGYNLALLGRPLEGIPHLRRAVQLQPRFPEAHNNLGVALMGAGQFDAGLAAFREALRLQPVYPTAHFNVGLAHARAGRAAEAIPHFTEAIRQRPDFAEAELNWAIALTLTDRFPESVPHFERALQLAPGSADARNHYARALALAGRLEEAITQGRRAVELNPRHAEAQLNLALALRQAGRLEEAGRHYKQARQLGGQR